MVLQQNSIDILAIQELNITNKDNVDMLQIQDYTLLQDNLIRTNGQSRAGLLVHKSVKYTRREDLSNQQEAHLAIAVHLTKSKKLLVHAWYRQWQEIVNGKKVPGTGTIAAQKDRLKSTIKLFTKSKQEAETLILSDTNINTNKITATEADKSPRDKQTSQVAKLLSTSILQEGFVATNTSPTHKRSTIDHIFSSNPIKILNVTTTETHMSDHRMVSAVRLTKDPQRKPRYTTSRQYSQINYQEMCQAINQDPRLYEAMQTSDTDIIANLIIQVIRDQLDDRAPKRRVQVNNKTTNPSPETTQIMASRDQAHYQLIQNPGMDNQRLYKNLVTQTKKSLKNDKKMQEKKIWKKPQMLEINGNMPN